MERKLRACLSVIVGVLFGLFIAFKTGHSLWWLGMIAGGGAGMLIYRWNEAIDATVASLPVAEGVRRVGRKFTLAATAFFMWLGWAYIFMLVMYFVWPGWTLAKMLSSGWSQDILIIASCAILSPTLGSIDDHGDKEDANWLARRYLRATFPLVLGWYMPRIIIWIVCHPVRISKSAYRLSGFLAALVATPFIAICSRKSLVIGFSIALGVAGGYLARIYSSASVATSLLVGILTALALAAVGLFLSDAAKQWVREQFG
jgi:hypothetical protein